TTLMSTWNGTTWSVPSSGPDSAGSFVLGLWVPLGSGAPIDWVVMKANPLNNEILVAIQDESSHATLWRWDGSAFPNFRVQLESRVEDKSYPAVAIAYEQVSGKAVIVWGEHNSNSCKYATWTGTSLSSTLSL